MFTQTLNENLLFKIMCSNKSNIEIIFLNIKSIIYIKIKWSNESN